MSGRFIEHLPALRQALAGALHQGNARDKSSGLRTVKNLGMQLHNPSEG